MPSNYWIKFYVEILDDSKVATLPDRLWRRFYELCLIAGSEAKDGLLPDTTRLAWRLRMTTDDLNLDLQQLASTGMIQQAPGGWLIVNYSKRQAPVPDNERYKEFRKRHPQYTPTTYQRNTNETQTQRLEITDNREQITEQKQSRKNSEFFTLIDAERLYVKITSQPTVPMAIVPYLEKILDMLRRIGPEKTNAQLQNAWDKWIDGKRKDNGMPYSRTNPNWIDNAIAELPPETEEDVEAKKVADREKEIARILEATKYQR